MSLRQQQRVRSRRLLWQAAFLSFLPSILLLGRFFTPGTMIADFSSGSDLNRHVIIWSVAADCMRSGSWPFWIPQMGTGGSPLWALYLFGFGSPFYVLFLIFPSEIAYAVSGAVHTGLAGLGMYLLVRRLGAGHSGGLVASVVFAGSDLFFGRLAAGQIFMTWPIAWSVWGLWALDRALARPTAGRIILAGLLLAFCLISGHVQMGVYVMGLVTVFLIGRRWQSLWQPLSFQDIRTTAFIIALGIGLSAIQWVPFLELWSYSGGVPKAEMEFNTDLDMPVDNLWSLLLPHAFGLRSEDNFLRSLPSYEWEWLCVSSATALWLSLVGLWEFRKRRSLMIALIGLVVGGLAIAMRENTPLHSLILQHLPLIRDARAAGRILFLPLTAIALLAAMGMRQLEWKIRRCRSIAGAVGLGLAVAGTAVLGLLFLHNHFIDLGLAPERVDSVLWRSAIGALLPLLISLLLLYYSARQKRTFWWRYGLVAVLLTSVVVEQRRWLVPTSSKILYDPPPSHISTEMLKHSRILGWQSNAAMLGYHTASMLGVLQKDSAFQFWKEVTKSRNRVAVANIGYASGPAKLGPVRGPMRWIPSPVEPLPRVKLFRQAIVVEGLTESLATLDEENFPVRDVILLHDDQWKAHLDATKSAEVKEDSSESIDSVDTLTIPRKENIRVSDDEAENVRVVTSRPSFMELETTSSQPTWLYIADKFYPGWVASVDDQPAPIARAFVAFRAIPLPAGTHRVVMEYKPKSVRIGLTISLASALVALVAFLFARRRRNAP